MTDPFGLSLFIIAVVVFLGWYAVGTQWNVRRGEALLRWLKEGLPVLGDRSTFRWLGSAAVEMKFQKARSPFRQAEIFIVLEPRDVPFTWAFFHARGRRDLLIVRLQLRDTPDYELEAFDPRSWSARNLARDLQLKGWPRLAGHGPLSAFAPSQAGLPALSEVTRLASLPGLELTRLAVHRSTPNLEVQWTWNRVPGSSSRQLFESLNTLAARLVRN